MVQQVIQRWDAFLANIEERHAQLMAEALQGCAAVHQQAGLDPAPIANAWMAIEGRAKKLQMKIDDTFGDKVEDAMDDEDAPGHVVDRERAKGEALDRRMEVERERTRIQIHADAARRIQEVALQEQQTSHACTQCGAQLEFPRGTYFAINVYCTQCGSLNSYEPGGWMRLAGSFCVHPLSEEAAWDKWLALQDAERAHTDARRETLERIQAHERAYLAYTEAYFRARARLFPQYAPALDDDIKGRMKAFYTIVERSRVWIEAGRPKLVGS